MSTVNSFHSYNKPRLKEADIIGIASTMMPTPQPTPAECVENRICMSDSDCADGVCEPIGPSAGFCRCISS